MQHLLGTGTNRGHSMVGVGIGLGVSGFRLRTGFEVLPNLDLQFATRKSITPLIGPTPTFTRASTGTYFNSQGVLTSAAVNQPRFDHVFNGTSWVSKGLLVEGQRTNLATNSELFSNASWTKYESSVTANAQTAPDGTNSGFKYIPSTNGTIHYLYMNPTMSANTSYTCSVFAKKAEYKYLQIGLIYNPTGDCGAQFDLDAGTVTRQSGQSAGYTAANATITNVGNGWFRCSVTLSANRADMALNITGSNTLWTSGPSYLSFTGDGTSGIYIWGAQMEAGSFATSYIPTTTASVTRSADVCQINGVDFSSLWNAVEGTVVAEYDRLAPIGSATPGYSYPRVFEFYGSAGNLIELYGNHVAEKEESSAFNSSVLQFVLAPTTTENVAFGRQSIALGIKENDVALAYKGGSVLTDSSFTMPSVNSLFIGSLNNGSYFHNGHIARLRYYNARLNNETIRYLST